VSNRKRGIIIGAVAGALLGALVAWVYTSSQTELEADGKKASSQIAPTDWVRLGVAILGVARLVGDLVKRA
jgi:hypothetical protein